jgi:predicted ester cyclase
MTRTEVEALLERHAHAFASRDPGRIAADHDEHGTFESPAAAVVSGREAIAGVYRYWVHAFPDMEFTWRTPIIDDTRVALFWHFRGTLHGDFFGHVKRGARVEFPGAAEYHVSPEGIVSAKHLFDFTGSLIAAGVLKVKPD